ATAARRVPIEAPRVEDLLRELAPQVLGALVRRYGRFDSSEDAVQEALLAAAMQWPDEGMPENPRAWLVTVASRRLVDGWRSESARRRREEHVTVLEPPDPGPVAEGGDTTAGMATAFLVPEPTMAQRISRAKQTIRDAGARFDLPPEAEREDRLPGVLHVLSLLLNQG